MLETRSQYCCTRRDNANEVSDEPYIVIQVPVNLKDSNEARAECQAEEEKCERLKAQKSAICMLHNDGDLSSILCSFVCVICWMDGNDKARMWRDENTNKLNTDLLMLIDARFWILHLHACNLQLAEESEESSKIRTLHAVYVLSDGRHATARDIDKNSSAKHQLQIDNSPA
eukprot:scaffold3816_cov128-Skeletonema_dohrnii-CCMP3373.AAC.3